MKKLLACCIAIIAVFGTYSVSYADSNSEVEITEDAIVQEFIEDANNVRKDWDKYIPENTNPGRVKRGAYDRNSIGSRGDILTSFNSLTGHAGLVIDRWSVIEANKGVGVEMRANEWPVRYTKILGLRVSNASSNDKGGAVSFAKKQLGEPYVINSSKTDTSNWYCSKLVWKSYLEQGINLDPDGGPMVTPGDLVDSNETHIFYKS